MLFNIIAMAPPAGGAGQGGGGGFLSLLPMILIFVILYFLILRPQARRQKLHQQMLEALTKGDKVVTTGGLHGRILKVNESEGTLIVKVAEDVKLEIDRGAIARKLSNQ